MLSRGGVMRWRPLTRVIGERRLELAVAEGVVVRHRWGTYALPDLDRARVAARQLKGALSHSTAALARGLDLLSEPDAIHVTLRPNAMRRWFPPDVRVHYADVSAEELAAGVTVASRTVLDCARTLPWREALALADSALRTHVCTRAELHLELSRSARRGDVRARRVIDSADPRPANVFESALRAILLEAGLTCFVPQLPVETPFGRYRVDLGDPVARIVVEAESFEFHGRRLQLTRDCARTNGLVVAGWLVLRFSWEQVLFEPGYVAAVLLAAHGRRVCKDSSGESGGRRRRPA